MKCSISSPLYALASLCAVVTAQSSLPQVDLGYEIHQAISLNVRYPLFPGYNQSSHPQANGPNLQLHEHQICSTTSRQPPLCSTCPTNRTQLCRAERKRRRHLSTSKSSMDVYSSSIPDRTCCWQRFSVQLYRILARAPSLSTVARGAKRHSRPKNV